MAITTAAALTGHELVLGEDEFIVSKTDPKGRITYVNRVFTRISGYAEAELVGKAHNVIRHPEMPRAVFELLWRTIRAGREVFAYVVNRCKNGDHYWVFAHVTPSFDPAGEIIGYHSNRRRPHRRALENILPIYQAILDVEAQHSNPKQATRAGFDFLVSHLEAHDVTYEEFVFSLEGRS